MIPSQSTVEAAEGGDAPGASAAARALRGGVCVVLAAAAFWLAPPPQELRTALALFVLIGGLWMTQALPLAVTALLVPVLAVLGGLAPPRAALAPFAHPIIFLFLGGFALAAALQSQGLDRALAQRAMRAVGGHRGRAVVLLCALAASVSMWISNTATAAMMLPLALGLLRADAENADAGAAPGLREQAFVLLAMAYSCSIGGMATLVGSPPNAIAAAQADIDFVEWLAFGLPAVLVLWPMMMATLWLVLRPRFGGNVTLQATPMEWTRGRRITVAIFAATVAGWLGGAPPAEWAGIAADFDTVVALTALVALVATGCLRWKEIEARSEWGVLLLFGGGLALSDLMQSSGANRFLAEQALDVLQTAPRILILAGMVVFVVFFSELISNTAATALLLPIFMPAALTLGFSSNAAAVGVALAASCGFMLPVATPPNALVYATGRVPQRWMMHCGFWLNLVCAVAVTAMVWIGSSGHFP